MSAKRYFLHRVSPKYFTGFPTVIIRDRERIVTGTVDGNPTRVYAPCSEPMPYLEAAPIARGLNAQWEAEKPVALSLDSASL